MAPGGVGLRGTRIEDVKKRQRQRSGVGLRRGQQSTLEAGGAIGTQMMLGTPILNAQRTL